LEPDYPINNTTINKTTISFFKNDSNAGGNSIYANPEYAPKKIPINAITKVLLNTLFDNCSI
tara:strand:- start:147 stop:332 length:186 start_codon:yes stop_codon:yes gene_type:complete